LSPRSGRWPSSSPVRAGERSCDELVGDVAAGAVLVASTAGKLPTLESFWVRPKIPKLAPNAITAAVAAAVTAPAVAIALRRCMRISLLCPPFARYAAA
jgi:hypothetical protein